MNEILEYCLVDGRMRIGKKELTFELLRKDSVIRELLALRPGALEAMLSKLNLTDEGDHAILDFRRWDKVKFRSDPAPLLNELKQRYGDNVGGSLIFTLSYTTFKLDVFLEANLDEEDIALHHGRPAT
ncbi:MAG: hypothetical protein FWF83_02905 [Clostridiales bacterium]|nr:hypothetical protein [Clostridiales bacterium]